MKTTHRSNGGEYVETITDTIPTTTEGSERLHPASVDIAAGAGARCPRCGSGLSDETWNSHYTGREVRICWRCYRPWVLISSEWRHLREDW